MRNANSLPARHTGGMFFRVVIVLGTLALVAMAAAVVLTALVSIGFTTIPGFGAGLFGAK